MISQTYTVSFEEVYPQFKRPENIPIAKDLEGYVVAEFRPPTKGEWFVGTGGLTMRCDSHDSYSGLPRAILKKNRLFGSECGVSLKVRQ